MRGPIFTGNEDPEDLPTLLEGQAVCPDCHLVYWVPAGSACDCA